jgi:hypothetical protein
VGEGTAEAGLRASGFGARRRLAFLQMLDQLKKSRDPISRAGRAQGALGERVGADEGQLGRRGGPVTQGERDHSAALAVAAPDGLDGEAAERPSSPNSYSGSPTGTRAPSRRSPSFLDRAALEAQLERRGDTSRQAGI